MQTRDSRSTFENAVVRSGRNISDLDAASAVDLVLAFYADVRASDVTLENDGDMLLCQWGIYDWGEGPAFEFDLTRQFIVNGKIDDDAIFQLSLTLRYDPDLGRSLERGHEWCYHPDSVDALRAFIAASPAFKAVTDRKPHEVTLVIGPAG